MEEKKLTGYPSIDKPWLKYYSEEAANAPLPEGSMYDYMTASNAARLDETALNFFGRKITYRKLISEIDCAADAFYKIGVRRGCSVLAFALNTPECIASIYALNRLGAVIDFQYVNITSKEVAESLRSVNTRFVMTADIFLPLIEDALKSVDLINSVQVIVAPAARSLSLWKRLFNPKKCKRSRSSNYLYYDDIFRMEVSRCDLPMGETEAPALIVHTSGTTGVPKGVLLSNKNVNAVAVEYKNSLETLKPGDTILNIAPPFVAFGICLAIHVPLCLGLQLCLSPSPEPETNGKMFALYRPAHFLGGPAHIQNIVQVQKSKKQNLSFIKTLGYGGETISTPTAGQYITFFRHNGADITHLCPGYGMTEFGGTTVTTGSTVWKEGSVGIPLCLANVKIVDLDTCKELPYGSKGEIWMSSPSLMLGYYKNPDEDSKVLIKDENGTRWMRTGDIGEIDQDGFVFLRGRIKRIYLTRGADNAVYKLFPDYIERIIRECPQVSECAVVATSEDGTFYEPVAFAAVQEGGASRIQEYCRDRLPEHMQPKEVRILDHIPSTTTGKADYQLLESIIKGKTMKT